MISWLRVALCMTLLVIGTLILLPVQMLFLWLDLPQRRSTLR